MALAKDLNDFCRSVLSIKINPPAQILILIFEQNKTFDVCQLVFSIIV